jgi:hypothetical protein
LISDDLVPGILNSRVDCKGIVAINPESGHSISRSSASNMVSSVLVFNRSGNGIFVVSTDEESLSSESGGEVEGSMEIAFTGCSFSKIGDSHFVLISDTIAIASATGLRQLCSQRTRHSEAVESLRTVMHSHLSTFGRIIVVTHALI